MSSQPVDHLHPVLDFAHRLTERLDSVARVPLWSMTQEQQRDALTTLAQAIEGHDVLSAAMAVLALTAWLAGTAFGTLPGDPIAPSAAIGYALWVGLIALLVVIAVIVVVVRGKQ